MLLDLRFARAFSTTRRPEFRRRVGRAGREHFVVLHAVVDGLQQQRAAARAGLHVLVNTNFPCGVGLHAVEILRALLAGLEERDGGAGLRLAGGAVDDDAIDRRVGARPARKRSERRAYLMRHLPSVCRIRRRTSAPLSNAAPQLGQTFFCRRCGCDGCGCCPALHAQFGFDPIGFRQHVREFLLQFDFGGLVILRRKAC